MDQITKIAAEELKFGIRSLQFRVGSGRGYRQPRVLVNGSPKTGTTWMIKLITSIPGFRPVGNFEGEIGRYAQVQPGEVVHGHDVFTPELKELLDANQIKVVLMVRDPRDQVVSRMFHIRRDPNNRQNRKFLAMSDDEAILACIEGGPGIRSALDLVALTKSWLAPGFNGICVKYEDLIQEPAEKFLEVARYLEIPLSESFTRSVVLRNRFERLTVGKKVWKSWRPAGQADPSSHFRKGIAGDWKNYFNDAHKAKFKEVAGAALVELGYETNFDW